MLDFSAVFDFPSTVPGDPRVGSPELFWIKLVRAADNWCMRMRLVRDNDVMLDEQCDEPTMVPPTEPQHDPEAPRGPRRAGEPAEPADGAVDAADDAVHDDAAEESAGESPNLPPDQLARVEALLFGTHHPLTAGRLAELLDLPTTKVIRRAIRQLNQTYADTSRSFRIEQVAGGYQILTLPEFGELLRKLHQREIDAKLTKPALETLAIIAYKQPILRADIEAIRGVQCGETIRSLMEKHLVKIAGRAEVPGRPILYGTTRRFLEVFGLNSLKDLPRDEQANGG